LTFRAASFEKLLNARKTASDSTRTGNTRTVFRIKRQLRTRLTERLSGNNTDWLVGGDESAGRHIDTITLARNTTYRSRSKDGLNLNTFNLVVFCNLLSNIVANQLISTNIAWNWFGSVAASDASGKVDASIFGFALVNGKAWIWSLFVGREDILSDVN
jgi:hypothetical protein